MILGAKADCFVLELLVGNVEFRVVKTAPKLPFSEIFLIFSVRKGPLELNVGKFSEASAEK